MSQKCSAMSGKCSAMSQKCSNINLKGFTKETVLEGLQLQLKTLKMLDTQKWKIIEEM
jgi:hypothetical protein